ncbi:hypothetical protein GQ457_15G024250 [Hibiscus cannabinus]
MFYFSNSDDHGDGGEHRSLFCGGCFQANFPTKQAKLIYLMIKPYFQLLLPSGPSQHAGGMVYPHARHRRIR